MEQPIDIKALRAKLNWTQDKLAEHLGVDRSTISRMENGQAVSGPVKKLLVKLSARPAVRLKRAREAA